MNEYQLTKYCREDFHNQIEAELEKNPVLIVTTQNASVGKWGLARLWRAWMSSTAKFMAANGCTMPLMTGANGEDYGRRKFDCNDSHELFTRQHLGCDADGTRLSWSKKGHDGMRPATKGERFNALFKHEIWASERGIILFKPRDSEYEKLEREQSK